MGEPRERAINAPWSVLLLIVVLLGAFAIQARQGVDSVAAVWGFAPRDLALGRYGTLVTAIFLHGGWPHVLANAAFALAFATPVARRLGQDALGIATFLTFYIVCGVLANLGYGLLNLKSVDIVIGASGAVAAMMGATSRLIGQGQGALAPFTSRPVMVMAAGWIAVNLVFGLMLPGWAPGSGGVPIAWQVHLIGYAAGLLLFGPLLSAMGRRPVDHAMDN
jgi:membrane associated rhomboid family serine protease